MADPIQTISKRLQTLRSDREIVESEIVSMMHEKESIIKTLPKILEKLKVMKESIDSKQVEVDMFDRAINEIERKYENVLFTSAFYEQSS